MLKIKHLRHKNRQKYTFEMNVAKMYVFDAQKAAKLRGGGEGKASAKVYGAHPFPEKEKNEEKKNKKKKINYRVYII